MYLPFRKNICKYISYNLLRYKIIIEGKLINNPINYRNMILL